MHIVIDGRSINTSTGRYIQQLLTYLERIDVSNQYSVIIWEKDVEYWKPISKNFKVVPTPYSYFSLGEQLGFNRLLRDLNPDLVHFCMPQQPILYPGKTVTTFHDLILLNTYNPDKNWFVFKFKQFVGRFVFRIIVAKNSYILVPSNYVRNELLKWYDSGIDDKIILTYESADVFKKATKPYKTPFKKFILYVGKQSGYKNIKRLGDAHQKLLERYPDLGLILVGNLNKSAQQTKDYFESKKYKNIHFTGFLEDPQRDWLYQNCEAYVFPSLMEGFGLPGLEAMGYGAPVVSSNATCLPEIYGDAAQYFDPNDIEDMVRSIDEVISSNELRSDLISRGSKQLKKYSWERMAQQTHDTYMKALGLK